MVKVERGDADTLHDEALRLVRAGDATGATARLRRALAADPRHHPTLHLAGLLAGRAGNDDAALALLSRAVTAGGNAQSARSAVALATLHERHGRPDAAETAYRKAIARDPGSADARLGLGHLLRRAGCWEDAKTLFGAPHPPDRRVDFLYGLALVRQALGDHADAAYLLETALASRPGFAGARGALAAILADMGKTDRSEAEARRAVAEAPNDAQLVAILARILLARAKPAEAAAVCRAMLAAREEPALLNMLGLALRDIGAGRIEDAADAFFRALSLDFDFADAHFNLAVARREQGRADEAIAGFRALIDREPGHAAARIAWCMAHLLPVARSANEATRVIANYDDALAALDVHADTVGAVALAEGIGAAQPFELPALLEDIAPLQRRYGNLACQAMAARYPAVTLAAAPRQDERVRLGIVTSFIRDHSAWRLPARGWVETIDRARFALTAYHTGTIEDLETAAARPLFDRFVAGPLPFERWREMIAADRPHALLYPEIGMGSITCRLAALRLAPVQYASWGHPATSGYPTIDAFLSADVMEPEDGARHYVERLVRLPGLSTPIATPAVPPPADRRSLGLDPDTIVFWSGQSLHKYAPRYDHVFAAIAARIPGSRFVFIEHPAGAILTGRFSDRLDAAFAARGLDAARHSLILPRLDPRSHDAAVGCADIFLDTIGWSGCNTLLVAIAHGLPVVTLAGRTMRARHAAAILDQLGAGAWVCREIANYVALAERLAREPETRSNLGEALRRESHRLTDLAGVRALEAEILAACAERATQ